MPSAFETAYLNLNTEQQTAVDSIDGPLLVIAGPGTGKTQLLSVRVANILKKTDSSPSNILCLTFTESAQANMLERLSRLIGPVASQVAIHTFHSFGNHIIGTNGDYFQEAFGYKPTDTVTRYEVLAKILEQLPHDNHLSQMYFGNYFYLKDIQARISQVKQAGLTPADLKKQVTRDIKWLSLASKQTAALLEPIKRMSPAAAPLFIALIEALVGITETSDLELDTSLGAICCKELAIAIENIDGKKIKSLTEWKDRWLTKNADGVFIFKAARELSKLNELCEVYSSYQASLNRDRLYDYDDMIMRVLEQFNTSPDLKAELQERYQYILVDEYQDTNGAQQRLIEALVDNPINENKPNLMAVGDDDQAIYSFQGANATSFAGFLSRWPSTETIVLHENYRSTASILSLSRQLIIQGNNRLEDREPLITKLLEAHEKDAGVQPILMELPNSLSMITALAASIQEKLKNGIEARKIAVLAPKHKYLEAIVPYLNGKDIPLSYERRQNVLDQQHVRELLSLVRVVVHIANGELRSADALLPELLSYEWWGIDTQWIWEIAVAAQKDRSIPWLELMKTASHPRMQQLADWLIEVARLSHTTPLEPMLDILIGPSEPLKSFYSPFREFYFGINKLDEPSTYIQLLSDLVSLRGGLRRYQPNEQHVLKDFMVFVNLCIEAGVTILNDHPVTTNLSAVQLMTAYKSKGLEFEVVYLIHADEKTWSKERGSHNTIVLPPNLQWMAPASESLDERLRLFYVAATRAKRELVLMSYEVDDEGKARLPLTWLTIPEAREHIKVVDPPELALSLENIEQALIDDWMNDHFSLKSEPPMIALLSDKLQNYQLSPTHLNAFLDVSHGGPKQFLVNQLLQFPQAQSFSAQYGTIMHAIMQKLHIHMNAYKKLPPYETAEAWLDELVTERYFGPIDEPKALRRSHISLELIYAQYAEKIIPGQQAEVDFAGEGVTINGARLKGRIDMMHADKTTKTATVIDYKTGGALAKWTKARSDHNAIKAHRYRQQLGFYQLLIEKSRTFNGFAATSGSLVFVEPDEDGKLITLDMTYEAEEKARLERLITVVYQHIIDMNLPDTKSYSSDLDGMLKFESDLLGE
jgi:DNA helicase-2/ATP-dependent DNA helicase PcrA